MLDRYHKESAKIKVNKTKTKSSSTSRGVQNTFNKKNQSTHFNSEDIISYTNGTYNNITSNEANNSSSNKKKMILNPKHFKTNPANCYVNEVDDSKNLIIPSFLYQREFEAENRRMTLEMIKYMNH